MHILRVTTDGPKSRSQQECDQGANEGPRGDSICNLLQRRTAREGGR
jgi:hypothetical protein